MAWSYFSPYRYQASCLTGEPSEEELWLSEVAPYKMRQGEEEPLRRHCQELDLALGPQLRQADGQCLVGLVRTWGGQREVLQLVALASAAT